MNAGPARTAPGASASLVLGILGVTICPICAILAIVFANRAKRAIAEDPSLEGEEHAKAGKVLGIVGVVLLALALLYFVVVLGLISSLR